MGKKDKEHRKKVAKRNQKIKTNEKLFQKKFQQELKKELEKLQEQIVSMSGETGLLNDEDLMYENSEDVGSDTSPTEK